ncbi:TetR/AcrR family transcriptional regulator [Nocardiopsis changdeensis]|uniref:TetR family transcriptional regulator n=1 Tax=Nocardiopsis changdeensis TaxID=2831969 RepID=A0ABX8BXL1_9ACTN|nr:MULTISPECIES: TetR/AcrR family transcriptional regulator [Nocardiopsis]QUX25543.1 TetR family transcriptional regulator [Nocardiopsis changdeensis]QYX35929.1 TetR family transcriptional regulator [Nocardiopsis sp. MT53]
MPRKIDDRERRERRELLADALMRLAAAQGLEKVSLRHVAAEAGVSTGMVQHYFRTKDEMMAFAVTMVMDRIRERSSAREAPQEPRALVRALLLEILPLDETRRLEGHVSLAFLAYAATKPSMVSGLGEEAAQMRAFLAGQLRAGGARGVDPERAAAGLLALVDGLGLQVLARQCGAREAVAALDAHLDLVFAPAPAPAGGAPPG